MSCTRLSLLTNVTRDPAATVTERGETPLDVMVIVALDGAGVGLGVGVGELGVPLPPPPPHDTVVSAAIETTKATALWKCIRVMNVVPRMRRAKIMPADAESKLTRRGGIPSQVVS